MSSLIVPDVPAVENEPQLFDQSAEDTLLATIIVESDRLAEITDLDLVPGDFYFSNNRLIFRALKVLETQKVAIDPITLADQLEREGNLAEIGGSSYIAKLLVGANGFNTLEYAKIVREKSRKRSALQLASQIAKLASSKDFDQDLDFASIEFEKLKAGKNHNGSSVHFSTWADLESIIGPIQWDWDGWIAKGFLGILVAMTGEGKSSLALDIGQRKIRRLSWPDGTPNLSEAGKMIWCEAEAAQALNLERAKKWGLPLDQILSPLDDPLGDFGLTNQVHRDKLAAMISRPDVVFAVVDSLSGADPTAEKSTEDTTNVNWLAALARDTQKPILLTRHLRKRSIFDTEGIVTLDRVRGISTILQYSRIIWAMDTPDANHLENKRLSVIKSNLGKKPEPLGLIIDEAGVHFGPAPEVPHVETATEKAADLLQALLHDKPMPAADLEQNIEQAGISWKSAKRAKQKLGNGIHKKE